MKNYKHKVLIRERNKLLNDLDYAEYYEGKVKIKIIQGKLHKINKEIKECIREYNEKNKPTVISGILSELKANRKRIEGRKNRIVCGLVRGFGCDILAYTTEYDWLHDKNFDLRNERLTQGEMHGCCYFGSEIKKKKYNTSVSQYISECLFDKLTIRVTGERGCDSYVIVYEGNPIIKSVAVYLSKFMPFGVLTYDFGIYISSKIDPHEVSIFFENYGFKIQEDFKSL